MTFLEAYGLIALIADEPPAAEVEAILRESDARIVAIDLADVVDVTQRVHEISSEETRGALEPLLLSNVLAVAVSLCRTRSKRGLRPRSVQSITTGGPLHYHGAAVCVGGARRAHGRPPLGNLGGRGATKPADVARPVRDLDRVRGRRAVVSLGPGHPARTETAARLSRDRVREIPGLYRPGRGRFAIGAGLSTRNPSAGTAAFGGQALLAFAERAAGEGGELQPVRGRLWPTVRDWLRARGFSPSS